MINLTGRAILNYQEPFDPKEQDKDLKNLSKRFVYGPNLYGRVTLQGPKLSGVNFSTIKNSILILDTLITSKFFYLDTLEGFRIQISSNEATSYKKSPFASTYIPSGVVKKYITNVINNDEVVELSRKNSLWMERIFNNLMGQLSVYVDNLTGAFHIRNINTSELRDLIYKKTNILTFWDKNKSELVIDFIYSEGKVDSSNFAIDIFHILTLVD